MYQFYLTNSYLVLASFFRKTLFSILYSFLVNDKLVPIKQSIWGFFASLRLSTWMLCIFWHTAVMAVNLIALVLLAPCAGYSKGWFLFKNLYCATNYRYQLIKTLWVVFSTADRYNVYLKSRNRPSSSSNGILMVTLGSASLPMFLLSNFWLMYAIRWRTVILIQGSHPSSLRLQGKGTICINEEKHLLICWVREGKQEF